MPPSVALHPAQSDTAQLTEALRRFSRFLSESVRSHPEWLREVEDLDRPLSSSDYAALLQHFMRHQELANTAWMLSLFRKKQLVRIVLRDALQLAPLTEITEELSNLADAILRFSLDESVRELRSRFGEPQSYGPEHAPASLAVIALGKLGGRELNYSSDIDLMFLYSENGETSGPQKITNKEYFKRVANNLTGFLSSQTAGVHSYRIDLRLRPEGNLGEICISLPAAKEYYTHRARDWELQMLIKARVAAGNEQLVTALLEYVEPFIYSSVADLSTVQSMSRIRERIAQRAAAKRSRKNQVDVKLDPGGIRDIEFLVQCLQRLHGARQPELRHGSTLEALLQLQRHGLLARTECSRLTDAYTFLRNLEHRLQMRDDLQTHSVPSDPAELDRLAVTMPLRFDSSVPRSVQLLKLLNMHLENVQAAYENIVHAQRPLQHAVPAQSGNAPVLLQYGNGTEKSTSSRDSKIRSRPDFQSFLAEIRQYPQASKTVEENPVVLDAAEEVFGRSPFLSEQLLRTPDLVEELRRAVEQPNVQWAFEPLAGALDDVHELRRFFRREMFRIPAASIVLREPIFATLDRTSALTEFVIARAYRIAREQGLAHAHTHASAEKPFSDPTSEMMVVALGRLGTREFDVGSDADLVFIIPDSEAPRQRFWTRVAEHMIDILTGYGDHGPILSLDTRLRPNGREGMLVQTESKYVEYFSNSAEAWEGIAYMKARGVAGDIDRALTFLKALQQVDWRKYGQSGRSKHDLRQMRMRLQKEQGSLAPLKAGEGGYYDLDFILMYLRLKAAGMFFPSLNTPQRIDIVEQTGHLDREDAESLLHAATFFRALDHAIRMVTGRAEEKFPAAARERTLVSRLLNLWITPAVEEDALESTLSSLRAQVRSSFEAVFGTA